ncbi:MAG: hypothetical protein ACI9D5_002589 [Candidatus Endobugula sp.]|jgi:hypothetical protein
MLQQCIKVVLIRVGLTTSLLLMTPSVLSAPKKVLLPEWEGSDESSIQVVDHRGWQRILNDYLLVEGQQNYFNYAAAKDDSALGLDQYIESLAQINPLFLSRKEQQAYWINLYNSATVQLLLQHYPTVSITKIGRGLFSFGPWNDDILTVNQTALSLNDIEHGILRPIYADPRIHYAVNCASLSCPNLMLTAFTADNAEQLLEQAASDYINHPRGVMVENGQLVLSSLYDWFQEDFGGNEVGVFTHLKAYAKPELLQKIKTLENQRPRYTYDWGLNQKKS